MNPPMTSTALASGGVAGEEAQGDETRSGEVSSSGAGVDGEEDRQAQEDEVEFMQAVMSREGEFAWRREGGLVRGTLNVFLQLEDPLLVSVAVREKSGARRKRSPRSAPAATPTLASPSQQASLLHLPPLSLRFTLPLTYPSCHPPDFSLSCQWLNFSQLSILCCMLDEQWQLNLGAVVLYTWQQSLADNTLSHLAVSDSLCLDFQAPSAPRPSWDSRAVQDMPHPAFLLPYLVEFDRKKLDELFSDRLFDCEVCFSSLSGSKCASSGKCGHVHCRDCLREHIATKVASGDVAKLECPSSDCGESLPPHLVKELVPGDVFRRYDELLLLRTLDGMGDLVYCPRPSCRCGTLRDAGSAMAQCPRCIFAFCVQCRRAWHGVAPCKLLPEDVKQLRETWEGLDGEGRREMEVQYGREQLQRAFQDFDSYQWIRGHAKLCPHCGAKIEKQEGCNKMTCTQCRGCFCWLCDAALSLAHPYQHFQPGASRCAGRLFEGVVIDSDEEFD